MKKKLLVGVLTLGLVFSSGMGAMAKEKPSETGGGNNGKSKTDVVSQQNLESEQTATVNQEKNKAEEKVVREQIKLERTNILKNALKIAGISETDAEDVIEEYQPAKGVFKVKGQHPVFDVPPVIKSGRTLIPVRAIMNGLGAEKVEWNGDEQKVTIIKGDKTIVIYLNSQEVLVNDEAVTIDVPAGMIANRVFVPLRFIAQTLGDKVEYDAETGDVTIGDENEEEVIEEEENTEENNDENTSEENNTDESSIEDENNDEGTTDENASGENDADENSVEDENISDENSDEVPDNSGVADENIDEEDAVAENTVA